MSTYPILFGFRDAVQGSGFVARVSIDGRLILVEEDDGSNWFYGVEPGGIAGHGATPHEALDDFRAGYRSVLYDIAEEAPEFDSFKALVEEFLCAVNLPNEALWQDAAKQVSTGNLNLDWLPQRPVPTVPIQQRIQILRIQRKKEVREAINDPALGQSLSMPAMAA